MGTEQISVPEGVMCRRELFRLAGGGALTLSAGGLLAACGSSSSSASSSKAVAPTGKVGGKLTVFTWQGYDLTKPLAPWRVKNHIQQTVKFLNNQFDVASILRSPAGKAYDSSSANQAYTHLFQSLGIMEPLSVADVPSLGQMFPFFRDSPIWKWSPGSANYNSAPWTWGAIGVNYIEGQVPKPDSWNVLIDPANKGRVGTLDDPYNNVSIAAIANGIDLTNVTKADLNGPIKSWLMKMKANLKTISPNLGDQLTLLTNKQVDYMSVGLSEFVPQATAQGAHDVGFVVPKEGGFGFCDAAFVTPWAPDKRNAFAFLEALLGGPTAAIAANNLMQGVAVPSVVPLLTKEVRGLYPYDNLQDYISKSLKFEVNYTPKAGQNIVSFNDLNTLWSNIKAS